MTFAVLNKIAALLGQDVARGMAGPRQTIAGDGAILIDQDRLVVLTKGTAAAITMAAPSAADSTAGRRITVTSGSAAAHVVTWPGAIVSDGTTGANTTFTFVAVAGCSFTVVAHATGFWAVESFNLGVFAP
jgi:hypothetical protein